MLFSNFDWITITLVLLALHVAVYYHSYYTRENPLPGPLPLPIIGNLHQLIFYKMGTIDLGMWTFHLHSKYGDTYEVYFGSSRTIIMGSPESIEKVYNPSSKNKFFIRPKINGLSELGMDDGLLFNNSPVSWKRSRKFIGQALLSPKFLRGFTNTAQDLFYKAERYWTIGTIVDFAVWIKCFTIDITVSTSTGTPSVCLLAYNTPRSEYTPEMIKSHEFLECLKYWFNSLPFFIAIPRILRLYFPGISLMNKRYLNNAKRLDDDILAKVAERRKQLENLSEGQPCGSGLLDMLLTFNTTRDPNGYVETEEKPMNDEEIRDNILDVMLAGSDTTGNAFCYFIYHIAHNPQCKKRLLEEIDSIFADDMTRRITYNDIEKLVYMDAAIKETLRLFPVSPISPRSLTNPETLLGYNWPAGQLLFVSQYRLMHNKSIWKDPHKFNPDRFLEMDPIQKKCYVPFGGGNRICPGRYMAMVELKTLFTLIYRKYDVELVDKNEPINFGYCGTFECRKLLVKLSQRK